MKKLYLIAAFWLLYGAAIAQSDTTFVPQTQAGFDNLFSTLNWGNVPTGVLIDKTLIFSDLDSYTGRDNEISLYQDWQQLYKEFYNASADRGNIGDLTEIRSLASSFSTENHKIPLLFLHFKYNRFVPDALANGLISIDTVNGRVYDQAGSNQLYEQSRVFAVAQPVIQHNAEEITYFIGREFWYGNLETPERLEIDFGDGQGFQLVDWDTEVTINYGADFTQKEILVRLPENEAEGWEALTARTTLKRTSVAPPDLIYGLKAANAWDGNYAKALAYVKWGNGNTSGKFCKPLIFVEGIDFQTNCANSICNTFAPGSNGVINPTDPNYSWYFNTNGYRNGDTGWDEMVVYNPEIQGLEKLPILRSTLEQQGYDIIFLDFSDGAGLIQENAMVLVELLNWVNNPNNRNCSDEAVVAAASMGGQVARFALSWMEQNTQCHNTKLYISVDSPHKGANVPLGYQYMVHDVAAASVSAEDNLRNLRRPASKQMLLLHMDASATPLRNAWQGWQASPDSYPKNMRKVAIANGSKLATISKYPAGDEIIETNILGNLIFILSEMRSITLNGKTVSGSNNVIYFSRFLTGGSGSKIPANPSWPLYDTAPGCSYKFGDKMKHNSKNGNKYIVFNLHQPFNTFMPTISTLDVKAAYGSTNLLSNVNLGYNVANNILPNDPQPAKYAFDAYYAPDNNEPHVQITDGSTGNYADGEKYLGSDNITWIMQQLQLVSALQPGQLASLYNFGSIYQKNLKTVTVNSGGELYVNKNATVTGSNPAIAAATGTYQLSTSTTCPPYVRINSGGKFTLGDDTNNNYRAEVFFKSGSTLDLSGGKLVINNNSRLVIEAGATLIYYPNSIIELNGDNAILEIRGNLNIAANAVFSFTSIPGQNTGYIKFGLPPGQSITVAPTSSIVLQGKGTTDKIVEVVANTNFNYTNWDIPALQIKDGTVEMKQNSRIYLGNTATVDNVHFKWDGTNRYQTIECYSKGNNKIKNSQFTGGVVGLTMVHTSPQDQSLLTGNQFDYSTTGLRSFNGNLNLVSNGFNNNTTGWRMDGGATSTATNSQFQYNLKGIEYNSTGGTLNLEGSTFQNNNGPSTWDPEGRGVFFNGGGILTGNCNLLEENAVGLELQNNAFVDFAYKNNRRPVNRLFNRYHNILFTYGGGLDFQNGGNYLNCTDWGNNYQMITQQDYDNGTAGISGTINNKYYNGGQTFPAAYNRWNNKPSAAPPVQRTTTYQPFDYELYHLEGAPGSHQIRYDYTIADNTPIGPNLQLMDCMVSNQRMPGSPPYKPSPQIKSGSANHRNTSGSCNQVPQLQLAVQQAAGLRQQFNPAGNDYLAFNILKNALQTVQPDSCQEFKIVLEEAYRMMRETYTASLVTDSSSSIAAKLQAVNLITDKLLNWKMQENDDLGSYYLTMDVALNGYAAGDLSQARNAIMQAFRYAPVNNQKYVQYWDCLVTAREQLRDSLITITDLFQQLDNCQENYSTARKAAPVTVKKEESNFLKLYPNPASGEASVQFQLNQPQSITIDLVDLNGILVQRIVKDKQLEIGLQQITIDLNARKNGMYFIRVYGQKFSQSGKLVVAK